MHYLRDAALVLNFFKRANAFCALPLPRILPIPNIVLRSEARYIHLIRLYSVGSTSMQVNSYPEGQDMGELFEVYEPPAKLGILPIGEIPISLGIRKPRNLVHRDGDWHRAVHVWLINKEGELLLQRRSKFKDTFPDMWDVSVGGHITAGDDTLQTVIKEVKEELGVDVVEDDLEFLFSIATNAKGSTEKHGLFNCNEYKDLFLLKFNGKSEDIQYFDGEVADVKWVHWLMVEENLVKGDDTFIPRSADYVSGLFNAIKERYI